MNTSSSLETRTPAVPVDAVDPLAFRDGMRKLASGVSLITTNGPEGPAGLAATAVSSVSFDPPSLLVCVNQSASAHGAILDAGGFAVNVLAGAHAPILDAFSDSAGRGRRFAHHDWRLTASGLPVLRSALAAFECRVTERIGYGTHSIIIGDVVAAAVDDSDVAPLIYLDRRTRSLADLSA